MDAYEATRIVFSRIQVLEPEHAAKIMGLLLIQDHGEKEMIRLAFEPETVLRSVIAKARNELGLLLLLLPHSPSSSRCFGAHPPPPLNVASPSWAPPSPDDFPEQLDQGFGWKPCLYFARRYCKNGAACRFLHGDNDIYACRFLHGEASAFAGDFFAATAPGLAAASPHGNGNHLIASHCTVSRCAIVQILPLPNAQVLFWSWSCGPLISRSGMKEGERESYHPPIQ